MNLKFDYSWADCEIFKQKYCLKNKTKHKTRLIAPKEKMDRA